MCPLSPSTTLPHAGHARDVFCKSWGAPQIGIAGRPSALSPDDDSPACCMGRRTHPTAQFLALILPDRPCSINARGSIPGRHAVFPMATGQGLPPPCGSLPAGLLSAGFIPGAKGDAERPMGRRSARFRCGRAQPRPTQRLRGRPALSGLPGGSRMIHIRSRAADRTPAPGVGAQNGRPLLPVGGASRSMWPTA
jgi:hypothetical protein